MNAHGKYTQVQSATGSPERLMALLFERAVREICLGSAALDRSDRAEAARALVTCSPKTGPFEG